jgi:DNA-binding NtrC family response regulator
MIQKLRPRLDPLEIISEQVASMLVSHGWPGNVRELRNVVERMLLFPERPETVLERAPTGMPVRDSDLMGLPFHDARRELNDRFEKVYLSSVLDACGGRVTRAADKAGITRQTMHRLMTKHRLIKP